MVFKLLKLKNVQAIVAELHLFTHFKILPNSLYRVIKFFSMWQIFTTISQSMLMERQLSFSLHFRTFLSLSAKPFFNSSYVKPEKQPTYQFIRYLHINWTNKALKKAETENLLADYF